MTTEEQTRPSYVYSCFLALALLTRIPLPSRFFQNTSNAIEQSNSLLFYPLAGLVVALPITAVLFLFETTLNLNTVLLATIALCIWVGITGALHLDGVADCSDALAASHKSPENILEIFKDPHAGAMAITAVTLTLIAKVALLSQLIMNQFVVPAVISACILSRLLAALYMSCTPYVRKAGLATNLRAKSIPLSISSLLTMTVIVCVLGISITAIIITSLLLSLYLWRRFWLKKINGYVGDCVGALIELSEILVLFILCGATG